MPITIQSIQQVAREAGKTDLDTITLLQAGAAAINDGATLTVLCDVKAQLLGLNEPLIAA